MTDLTNHARIRLVACAIIIALSLAPACCKRQTTLPPEPDIIIVEARQAKCPELRTGEDDAGRYYLDMGVEE